MKAVIAVGAVMMGLTGHALAQSGADPSAPSAPVVVEPRPAPVAPVAPVAQPRGEVLDEDIALGLSLGGTVAAWSMILGGAVLDASGRGELGSWVYTVGLGGTLLAPGLGHWYAGTFATRGLGLRALGAGAAFAGLVLIFGSVWDQDDGDAEGSVGVGLLIAGGGLYVGGTIDDIVTAPGRVRRHNQRFEHVTLVPTIHHTGGGLAIAGRF
ncbi:MAG: hypothetical protein ACTHU0_18685 [Kofleriaceae bacterium]